MTNDSPKAAPSSAPDETPRNSEPAGGPGVGLLQVTPEAAQAFRRNKWLILIMITVLGAAVDQWTKQWAHQDLQFRPGGRVTLVEGYAAFSYVRNPGAAWGFLADADESFRKPFFVVINIAAMLFILYIHFRLEPGQYLLLVALACVLSGAVGNFIDRLKYNYVVDFIKVHYQYRFEWPTFNVADIAITCGVILLFAEMFITPILRRRALTAAGGEHRLEGE